MPTIRQATYEDKPALAEFLAEAYAGRAQFKYPQRWEWAYEKNPYLRGDAPPIWIAIHEDGHIIGQSNALVEPLIIHGQAHTVAWGVDFYVLPEFRGRGIGSQLQAANHAANEIFMSISMAKSAARIKARMGMTALPKIPEYTKIVNHTPETLPRNLPRPLRASIAQLLNWRDARPLWRYTPPKTIIVTRVAAFDAAFDQLWERVSPKFNALVKRDAAYLHWKHAQQPHTTRDVFVAQRAGTLIGYVIVRVARPPERNTGILLDLFCDPEDSDTTRALLHRGTCFLKDAGVTTITAASSVPAFQAALTELGYKITKTRAPMIKAGEDIPLDGWLLGKGDHDWDQFPLG